MGSKSVENENCSDVNTYINFQSEDNKQRDKLHGHIYHLKQLMLFLYRGVSLKYSFRLGKEIEEALKFDDIVFEFIEEGKKKYRFFQIKHRLDESKKISADSLLTETAGDYSLIKYFFSYQDCKKDQLFKGSVIKDVTICTNVDFDHEHLKSAKIRVEKIETKDDISDVKSEKKQPMRYSFNEDVTSSLKPKLEDFNLTRLARRLAKCLLKGNPIKHHDKNDVFKSYHRILGKEVINIKTKKFYDEFTENRVKSEETKKFRKAFIEEIKSISKERLVLENINEAITNKRKIIDDKQVGLNLSKNFGKGEEEKIWPINVISEDDIKDYLNHLIFAVNQPNEEELGEIVKEEIGMGFSLDSIRTEEIYNKFFMKMLSFLQGKEKDRFLSYEEGEEFFEEARRGIPIWFNITRPVESFIGRVEQLEKLHISLKSRGETAVSQIASVSGLGGIGKTELVKKYVHDHGNDYDGNVVWINAETCQTLAGSFLRLAQDKLGINVKNTDGNQKDMKSIVEDVYAFFSKRKSLFIFDNAEKHRSQDDGDEGIDKYLPCSPSNAKKPYILITSRNQKWGNIEVIPLGTFTEKEATDFIKKALIIEGDSQNNEIQKLMEIVERFPLALTQAVSYIKQADEELKNIEPEREFKIHDYLKEYKKKTKELLNFPFPDYSNDKYSRTTFTTFQITVNKIKKKEYGKEALEILDIIAYCAPDKIPTKMFLKLVEDDKRKLGASVQLLKQYSMVNLEKDFVTHSNGVQLVRSVLNVHRLVQQVTRINLEDEKREEETLRKALELIKSYCSEKEVYFSTEDGKLSSCDKNITSIWSYASTYDQLIKDFYSAYGKDSNTPIHLFSINGKKTAIESILKNLEKGKLMDKVNEYNEKGYAPIHLAAFNGHLEIVKYFVEIQGVNIDFITYDLELTPTFVAVLGDQLSVVQYLVGRGADPNRRGKYGQFPIICAAVLGRMDLIECLINNNANILSKDQSNGNNILHAVLYHLLQSKNHLSSIEEFIKYCLEKNSVLVKDADVCGMTPLHIAASSGSARIVKMLLDCDANVNAMSYISNQRGADISHTVVDSNKKNIARNLKGYDGGYTPLHIAAKENHFEIVKLLLQKGAIYNVVNKNMTPLDMAEDKSEVENLLRSINVLFKVVMRGKKNLVDRLLKGKDSDVLKSILNARNDCDKTLLDVAITNKKEGIENILKTYILKK